MVRSVFPLKALHTSTLDTRTTKNWDRADRPHERRRRREVLSPARKEMKICSFLWVYYGYPTSCYEGINVEEMRYHCGRMLAKRDHSDADLVAGIPDSGIAHAVGYANESGIPFCPSIHQIYPNLAAFLHADHPEPEKPDRHV